MWRPSNQLQWALRVTHSPHYAVDDKVVKTIWAQECVHTKGELTPWVIIDLQATFDVEYVTLFNRIDEHGKKWDSRMRPRVDYILRFVAD